MEAYELARQSPWKKAMAIRLRRTADGTLVAICAARSVEKVGDVYLSDEAHHALSIKFDLDFGEMGFLRSIYENSPEEKVMDEEESNNSARTWWDSVYGQNAI
jgi:hypothetical protein